MHYPMSSDKLDSAFQNCGTADVLPTHAKNGMSRKNIGCSSYILKKAQERMLFNFRFFPFPEIITEKTHEEAPERRALPDWYHLTDGWYWLDVGETQIFRYTQAFAASLEKSVVRPLHQQYVDYFVVELWESVMNIFSAILEPIPRALAQRLEDPISWNTWITNWYIWRKANREAVDDIKDENVDTAVSWWVDRRLDTGYLVMGPNVFFWSDGERVHIVWDNRDRVSGEIPVWDARVGQFMLPVAAFVAEVVTFNHRFHSEMAERVVAAQQYWSPREHTQEFFWLQKEQERHTHSWDEFWQQTSRSRDATDWEQVLAAIATVERDAEFQRIQERGTHP